MREWVRRRRLVAFYLLAVLSVTGLISLSFEKLVVDVVPNMMVFLANSGLPINVVGIGAYALERPATLLVLAFMIAPTAAAILIALLADGGSGLRRLLRRLHPWPDPELRETALRSYGILLFAYVVAVGACVALTRAVSPEGTLDSILDSLRALGLGALVGLLLSPLLDEGSLFQELGWRGYALPLLIDRVASPLKASLVLALMWWAWYLPREFSGMAFGVPLGSMIQAVVPFLAYLVSLSVLITYFWFRTGGSVLPAIWIHGGANALGRLFGGPINSWAGLDVRMWTLAAAAVIVVWRLGPELGRVPRTPAPPVEGEVQARRDAIPEEPVIATTAA